MAILTELLLEDDLSHLSSVSRGRWTVCRKEARNCFPCLRSPPLKPAPLGTFETNYKMAASDGDLTFDLDDLTNKKGIVNSIRESLLRF